jgi:predicted nucleotidyltransferase component of viral defense system
VKLFEHHDFDQAIIHAAEYFRPIGVREAFIEKDYYVTEALRIVQQVAGDKVIFKGGTSLSKGWNIIQRFSEDVDIFFDPTAFEPYLGKNAINRELKLLRQAIECHPGLKFIENESRTVGGFGRSDYFEYASRFSGTGEIRNRVLVEVGTASGREPTENVKLQSYLAKYLQDTGISLGANDEGSFEMRLLHFRRTFVEKMFAIHSKVETFKRTGIGIGGYARHYYDLFCLSERKEVLDMLRSSEYEAIKIDYDKISEEHFKTHYVAPENMSFAKSDAIFPRADLESALSSEFEKQCKILCFGKYPTWKQIQQRFREMRPYL